MRAAQRTSSSLWKVTPVSKHRAKTWGQQVAEDPRYKKVKELVAQDKFDEAQDLENQIVLDVTGPRDPR